MSRVTVVGACNLDLIFHVDRLPQLGESLPCDGMDVAAGGKGLNQAIGAARLGARTALVGQVGRDPFGDLLWQMLAQEGVNRSKLHRNPDLGTGIACPMITSSGENAILFAPRANMHLSARRVRAASSLIKKSDILLLQQEVSDEANLAAAAIATEHDVPVMLNAAPARSIPPELLAHTDLLVLNEIEAGQLAEMEITDLDSALAAARTLQDRGPRIVVITLGPEGAMLLHPDNYAFVPTHEVDVVDTTGAGDAFCAGFAVALAQGELILDAVDFGNACGALACTRLGAGPSMPVYAEVQTFLESFSDCEED